MTYNIQDYNQNQTAVIRLMISNGIVKSPDQFVQIYASMFRKLFERKGKVLLSDFNTKVKGL